MCEVVLLLTLKKEKDPAILDLNVLSQRKNPCLNFVCARSDSQDEYTTVFTCIGIVWLNDHSTKENVWHFENIYK